MQARGFHSKYAEPRCLWRGEQSLEISILVSVPGDSDAGGPWTFLNKPSSATGSELCALQSHRELSKGRWQVFSLEWLQERATIPSVILMHAVGMVGAGEV